MNSKFVQQTSLDFRKSSVVIWIEQVSLTALVSFIKIGVKHKNFKLIYFKADAVSIFFLRVFKKIFRFDVEMEQINVALGDLWIENTSMATQYLLELPILTNFIVAKLKKSPIYVKVCQSFSEKRVDNFFKIIVNKDIQSFLPLLLTARWHKQKKIYSDKEYIILSPHCGIYPLLKDRLSKEQLQLLFYKTIDVTYAKQVIKNILYRVKVMLKVNNLYYSAGAIDTSLPKIAVHYVEGIDTNRRSDIFWYIKETFNSNQVLIYIDQIKANKEAVSSEICDEIIKKGMSWVALTKRALSEASYYKKNYMKVESDRIINHRLFNQINFGNDTIEKWLLITSKNLIEEVNYWIRFYEYFNIKVIVDFVCVSNGCMAQNIALDLVGGIRTGIQRSTLALTDGQPFLVYNCNDIFFTWGDEVLEHKSTCDILERFVEVGFPFDYKFYQKDKLFNKNEEYRSQGKFVIALFGSVFTDTTRISRKMMVDFYEKILSWVIEDHRIVIVAKEKKSESFEKLSEIKELLIKANETGRYIQLDNPLGRLPFDASFGADLAIGVGISSAVSEAVIAGCRGIHCDISKFHFHPYYQWGNEKVIFDNTEEMIKSVKEYMSNPLANDSLGNWSKYEDRLDSFRDGKAGVRIRNYLNYLISHYECNQDRSNVIKNSDKIFQEKWGKERIINLDILENKVKSLQKVFL
ncbi:MAG: hypothetical protein KC733_01455 [Candidatus Omnitrophica bacterium]|nr:hypothetical protein [Candidatus Omnitrophota bacterium]